MHAPFVRNEIINLLRENKNLPVTNLKPWPFKLNWIELSWSKLLFSDISVKMVDGSNEMQMLVGFWTSEFMCFWKVQQKWIFKFTCCILQNSERRLLKQWAEDTKQELSLANKELTAVSFLLNYYICTIFKSRIRYSHRKEEKKTVT